MMWPDEFLRVCQAMDAPQDFKDAAARIVGRVGKLDALKRELRGDADQLYAEAETVITRFRADKRLRADAAADLWRRLP